MPSLSFSTPGGGVVDAQTMVFKGGIAVASDFPTLAEVQIGWTFRVTSNVTDNDVTKTNTGSSFVTGDEIAWNGTDWTVLGSVPAVGPWVDDGTVVRLTDPTDNVGMGTSLPFTDFGSTAGDFTAHNGLHIKTSGTATIALESAGGAAIVLGDRGGALNFKIGEIDVDGGLMVFRTLNDDLTIRNDNAITINLDTGAVNVAGMTVLGTVVTGLTSITSTAFVGNLTGNSDTVTTNANLTGEVTSVGNAASLDVTSISNQTLVTTVAGDFILIQDATDGLLKRANVSDLIDVHNLTGEITSVGVAAVLDVTAISNQTLVTGVAGDFVLIQDATDGLLKRVNVSDFITNDNLTGEVTSVGNAASLDVTAISNQSLVTTVAGDFILIQDATDGLLKRANVSDLIDVHNLTGEVTSTGTAAVLDVTAISNQTLVTTVAGDFIIIQDATDGLLKRANVSDLIDVHNLTGEVTSTGTAAVLDVTAISNQTLVTAVAGDFVLIQDATDGLLKRVNASDFIQAGSPWVDDGSVVRLSDATDSVGIGTSLPFTDVATATGDYASHYGLHIKSQTSGETAALLVESIGTTAPAKLILARESERWFEWVFRDLPDNLVLRAINFDTTIDQDDIIVVTQSGNVGIGRAPGSGLDVHQNFTVSNAVNADIAQIGSGVAKFHLNTSVERDDASAIFEVRTTQATGDARITWTATGAVANSALTMGIDESAEYFAISSLSTFANPFAVIDLANRRMGIGLAIENPLNDFVSATGDIAGSGLHLKTTGAGNFSLAIESQDGPSIYLGDRGGTANQRILQIENAGLDKTVFRILNDDLTTNHDDVISISNANGRVGFGINAALAKVHIDQSNATGAIPVLTLDQADLSEEFINFIGTVGVGNSLEAVGAKTFTLTHFIKINTPDGIRYLQGGTIA